MTDPFSQDTNLPHETLISCVRRFKNFHDVHLVSIPTGKFNTSFFVKADNEDLVLRVAPSPSSVFLFYERNMMKQEPLLHALLRTRTSVPVAKVLYFDESRDLLDRDFIILERLPGVPMTEAAVRDVNGLHREIGALLAQVHSITKNKHGYIGPHEPMVPQDNWADAFRIMWHKLLEDVASTGHYSNAEVDFFERLLEQRIRLFQYKKNASLLHMDIWDQNILTDGKHVTGILDWDRALWGDPEIEFAVLDYCGVSTPAFWEGYGMSRNNSKEAQIRNLFYLLYEVQKYIVIRHGRNHDAASAIRYKEFSKTLAQRILQLG